MLRTLDHMLRNPRRVVILVVCAALVSALGCQPEVPAPDATFTVSGGGYGHGVGMSQYGAYGRALAGHDVAQILDAYYPGTAIEPRSLGNIRVHIGDAQATELTNPTGNIVITAESGASSVIAGPNERLAVRRNGASVQVQVVAPNVGGTLTFPGAQHVYFSSAGDESIRVAATGRSYRFGRLDVSPNGVGLRMIVRDLSMDQYLYGLGEMPASWPLEALKAQAIAGRSYAARALAAPKNAEFDLYSTTVDQAYVGTSVTDGSSYGANWKAAVDATSGRVLTHGAAIAQTYYSSSNGGFSERSDYVWASSLPYLIAAADPFDAVAANKNSRWTRTFTATELGAWVENAGRGSIGAVTRVELSGNLGASGRAERATVKLVGVTASATMTGAQFRTMINNRAGASRQLLSTRFTVSPTPGAAAPDLPQPGPPPATNPGAAGDTTPPNLAVWHSDPMTFGAAGQVCSYVTSDEPTIYALSINLRGTEVKSPVGGVSPDRPALMCIAIPARLRPTKPTLVTFTAVGIDAAVNYRFVVKQVTVQR